MTRSRRRPTRPLARLLAMLAVAALVSFCVDVWALGIVTDVWIWERGL